MNTPSGFASPPQNAVGAEHFVTDGTRVALRVTRCRDCPHSWFPARTQCSNCASRNVFDDLTSTVGTVYASTVVRVGPPGFLAPYTLAYVDVDDVRLLAHVVGATDAPVPDTVVDLVLADIGAGDDSPVKSYAVVARTSPAGAR